MIKDFLRLVWKEEHEYYSERSLNDLRNDIKITLRRSDGFDFSFNMKGDFISENQFEITPKWSFVHISNYERDLSYLKGELLADSNATKVRFSVRPNTVFLILAIGFFVLGLVTMIASKAIEGSSLIGGLVISIVVPIVSLLMAYVSKQGIKNRFIRHFKLRTEYVTTEAHNLSVSNKEGRRYMK